MARLFEVYKDTVVPELTKVWFQVDHGSSAYHQDHPEHGCPGEAVADKKVLEMPSGTCRRLPVRSR